jgi:glucan endo-1,3-alpha-glucosidase
MIASREYVDIVEIITWNDYGESHYIGPIEGAQPNSQAWVNGFDHQGMFRSSMDLFFF